MVRLSDSTCPTCGRRILRGYEGDPMSAASTYKHEWTLELPKLTAPSYQNRNLCVQMQQSANGNYRAVLVDLGEFRGEGSVQGIAIDDLADELEHVAAEIRRASSFEALVVRGNRGERKVP
jgi:hypothetical protein